MPALFPTYLKNCPARKEVEADYYKLIEKLPSEEDGKEDKERGNVSLSKNNELLSDGETLAQPVFLIKLK